MFAAHADVERGRTDDARLPFSLSDLHAHVELNNDGFELTNLNARNGPATLEVRRCRGGYSRTSPMYLEVVGKRIALDHNLVRVLPEPVRKQWSKYSPEGEIDVDLLRLVYDGVKWTTDVTINCLNVSFSCDRFPYRLDRATGRLKFNDQKLTADLTAYSGARPIVLNVDIDHPGPNFTGWIEARGDKIPLDEKLLAALNDSNRPVLRSLNPQGTFNFFLRNWRDEPDRAEMHQHLLVSSQPLRDQLRSFSLSARATSAARWKCSTANGPWASRSRDTNCREPTTPALSPATAASSRGRKANNCT